MNNKLDSITNGLSASTEIVVGTRDTAHHVGSGKIKVLATPVMVTLMEEAALMAVEGLLPEGYQSVGTNLNVSHIAATPVGCQVSAYAEVVSVDGHTIHFAVSASDNFGPIGHGTHERVVVNLERFDKRVQEKVTGKDQPDRA